MRTYLLGALLLAAGAAHGACKDHARDPTFVELAVPEGAPRPAGVSAFAFVDENTTVQALQQQVGPPDASAGTSPPRLIWCLTDGTEVSVVVAKDGTSILFVRHAGKTLYKRKKK